MANPQEQGAQMSKQEIMQKKISDLTQDEINQILVPLGLPGMGFPMVEVAEGDEVYEKRLSVVESATNFLRVHSHLSPEKVYGMLQRQHVIPSMMLMMREMIIRTAPESKNRRMTIFGDAGSGKSHLFRMFGKIMDPQGAIVVDCGGMNMRELFFRTVVDYGKGVKDQFEDRLGQGKISQETIDMINAEFPGAIIQKDDRSDIDWAMIGARRTDDDGKTSESYEEAVAREQSVMSRAYAMEKINVQSNAFGIKTVKGEVLEAFEQGRFLFLDEYNKSKGGTLDKFQTFLQFAKGEIDEVTIHNELATSDDDSPKSVTLRRKDMPANFFLAIAGNDTSDGSTTQELSVSMEDRLDIHRIQEFTVKDWEHRLSQYMTGLPLATYYEVYNKQVTADPEKFGQWLLNMRTFGLSEEEVQAIPQYQMHNLKNYQDTLKAVKMIAADNDFRSKMANAESSIHEENDLLSDNPDVQDELMSGGHKIKMSPRKFDDMWKKAVHTVPTVRKDGAATLAWDFTKAFANFKADMVVPRAPGWHRMGENYARVRMEQDVNDTQGMPRTQAILIEHSKQIGMMRTNHDEAENSGALDYIGDLLKVDDLSEYGGFDYLADMRGILMSYVKEQHKDKQFGGSDDSIMPLDVLGRALYEAREEMGDAFLIPNDELNDLNKSPVIPVDAVKSYEEKASDPDLALVDFKAALLALALPQSPKVEKEVGKLDNSDSLWPKDLLAHLESVDESEEEAYKILTRESEYGLNLLSISALNSNGERDLMYMLSDEQTHKKLIVGPENISSYLNSILHENNIQYIDKTSEGAADLIGEFIKEGAEYRYDASTSGKNATGNLDEKVFEDRTENFLTALMLFCDDESIEDFVSEDGKMLRKGLTLGQVLCSEKPLDMHLHTSIVKRNNKPTP